MRPAAGNERAGGVPGRIFQVGELNAEIHHLLETSYPAVWLEGELSNFRHFQASGHWYFTLKDDRAQVAAAMFRGSNRRVRFRPEDGTMVLVRGQVSLYEPRGTYQIIVSHMEPRGAGALHAAFEELKARLEAEGLFAAERKRPLPALPRRIGVVTSRDGAAFRDILRVLRRRHSGVSVLLIPARVQGEGSAGEIAAALRRARATGDLDALIVGRGGGSLEDLCAFNEEVVARAIADCAVPVISAVGHEVDITIADFVADVRAPTPSAAAEMVVSSRQEMQDRVRGLVQRLSGATRLLLTRLRAGPAGRFGLLGARPLEVRVRRGGQKADELAGRLTRALERSLTRERRCCEILTGRLSPRSLMAGVAARRERLHAVDGRLVAAASRRLGSLRQSTRLAAGRLAELSPLAVLERGYSVARLAATGAVLRDAREAVAGDPVELTLHRGGLRLEVRGQLAPDDEEPPRTGGREGDGD
jgi:exodeoxyribonuclease VII large subunit